MRYTILRDQRVPPPRKLAWAVVGLCFVLAGSAALAWQNGGPKLRPATVEVVEPALQPKAVKATPKPAAIAAPAAPAQPTATARPMARRTTAAPPRRPALAPAPAVAAAPPRQSLTARTANRFSSFLPFPLPSFGAKKPAASAPAAPRTTAPRATSKALGGNRRAAPPSKNTRSTDPEERPPADERVADSAAGGMKIELPPEKPAASPAPQTKRSAPTARVAEASPVASSQPTSSIPRTLSPLQYPKLEDVRAAGFQDVTPGETKLSGIAQKLGEPLATEREGDTTVLTYKADPFPKVEVILAGDVVDTVIVHLKEAAEEQAVLAELGLTEFRTVDVLDEDGELLGRAVPERGVALSYQGDPDERLVAEVVLAMVTSESFLLRASANADDQYQHVLADAAFAARLDPTSAQALAIQARVLQAIGRMSEARTKIEAALKIDADSPDQRLLYARLLSQAGDYASATKIAETIAASSAPPEQIAQAELLWGDLLSHGPERDYQAAVEHHTQAIKLATPLSQDANPATRRTSLLTLVDANLAIARDVALGNYKRKSEVVPKWISKADAVKQLALQDGASGHLELHVFAQTLAAYACLSEPLDPTPIVEAALSKGQDLISESSDPLYKRELEWMLGTALVDAVQIEHARGEFSTATQYANNALALLRDNAQHWEATPHRDFVLGRMFFSLGALYAVGKNDHAEAVHYYLEAIPLLQQPLPADLADEQGRHGERFVSMGVSFWQNGNKTQAVELTLTGANLLTKATEAGQIENASLAVPYSNLAAMYKQLGNSNEAKKYGDLATRAEDLQAVRR